MHEKTMSEYQDELKKLEKALKVPGIDAAEKKIYQDTIGRIRQAMQALSNKQQAPAAGRTTAGGSNAPKQAPGDPIVTTKIKAGITPLRMSIEDNDGEPPVITADITGGNRMVTIRWNADTADTLTEGEVRSRFTTALRDLSESRLARQGRFSDIPQYIIFQRAVAYYQALSLFWGSSPSAAQLNLTPLSRVKQTIFELITGAAVNAHAKP